MSPLGWLYGKIINLRNARYEKGVFKSHNLGAPTISVGNITVGGTGKTPLVAYIAEILADKGEKVCVISRGYKRENEKMRVLVSDWGNILVNVKKAGDEPFELASKLLGKAIVIADANRVEAGKWAAEKFGVTAFVLDDAFQHRKAKRDLDIVVIDATNPFGKRKSLPSGILREPLENLKRADLFVLTRTNLIDDIDEIRVEIEKHNQTASIVACENKISSVTKIEEFLSENRYRSNLIKDKALAFCALGNPDNFFDQLEREGFKIVSTKAFRDHHPYSQKDVKDIEKLAREHGAKLILTTAKDAAKLGGLNFNVPCYVVENNLSFDDAKKLRDQIDAVFQ